jgi:hypothetical protein
MIVKGKFKFTYIIPLAILLVTCHVSCKSTRQGKSTDIHEDPGMSNPDIIFINYSVKADKTKMVPEIRLINKIITKGRLKKNIPEAEIPKSGDIFCFALNTNMEPVDSIIIPDPLNATIESVDGDNKLFKKEIALDSAEFTVRMQLNREIYAVGLKTREKSKKSNGYLLITKIRLP